MINPRQCRGARALLGITQQQLSDIAGISKRTVIEFEGGLRVPTTTTTQNLQIALESEGIEFLFGNGGGTGVRFRDPDFEDAMSSHLVSRRHVLGRAGVLAGGAIVGKSVAAEAQPAAAATKVPNSFAATELSPVRFELIASREQKQALELFKAGILDVPDAIARRATLARFEGDRQYVAWQGAGIELFPKARNLAGIPMAEQPDAEYGRWAESRVMRAFQRGEAIFELCRGLVEVDGSRTVWRYFSLRLPRPDGTTLNVTARA